VAKTLGIRLPKDWETAAAALEPGKAGVSTETEDETS
jgi:hypothetical protein